MWGAFLVLHPASLAGGLCVQAICFMAIMYWSDEVQCFDSYSEITQIGQSRSDDASSDTEDREIRLEGLTLEEMDNYLKLRKLSGAVQYSREGFADQDLPWLLEAYLSSGVPVAVQVDEGKLTKVFEKALERLSRLGGDAASVSWSNTEVVAFDSGGRF